MAARAAALALVVAVTGAVLYFALRSAAHVADDASWANLRDDACDDDVACWPGACTELRASIVSPDRAHVARVFLTTGGGATVADGAEVCVDDGWRRRLVGVGYDSDQVGAAWISPTTLRIDHLGGAAPPRTVDVTSGAIACEPVRDDWKFCTR